MPPGKDYKREEIKMEKYIKRIYSLFDQGFMPTSPEVKVTGVKYHTATTYYCRWKKEREGSMKAKEILEALDKQAEKLKCNYCERKFETRLAKGCHMGPQHHEELKRDIHALAKTERNVSKIAKQLDVSRETVKKYLRLPIILPMATEKDQGVGPLPAKIEEKTLGEEILDALEKYKTRAVLAEGEVAILKKTVKDLEIKVYGLEQSIQLRERSLRGRVMALLGKSGEGSLVERP